MYFTWHEINFLFLFQIQQILFFLYFFFLFPFTSRPAGDFNWVTSSGIDIVTEKKTFTIYYINNQQQKAVITWALMRVEKTQQQQQQQHHRGSVWAHSRGFLDFCSHRRCGQTQFKYFNHEIIRNVMLYQWEWKFMVDLCGKILYDRSLIAIGCAPLHPNIRLSSLSRSTAYSQLF